MFGAVNRDQDEFVFEGEGGNLAAVEGDGCFAAEEIFDGQRARKVAQGALGVQLNE